MVKDLSSRLQKLKIEAPVSNSSETSRITAGTTVKGEIITDSDIRIDGTVEGRVNSSGKVIVGERAVMSGDIECSTVDFWGTIEGNMNVGDVLSLKHTACVNGDIRTRKIQVELGAQINGSCHMHKDGALRAKADQDQE